MNLELTLSKAASVVFLAPAMAGCGGGGGTTAPETEPAPASAEREAIKTAIGMAETAVAAVDYGSTDAEVSAADSAIMAARSAITAAANVPAQERAADAATVDARAIRLTVARTTRTTAMSEADKAAETAMAATAVKLHAGIDAPTSGLDDPNMRHGRYIDDGASIQVPKVATGTFYTEYGWDGRMVGAFGANRQ